MRSLHRTALLLPSSPQLRRRVKHIELEAVASDEAASGLCTKVPRPVSVRPRAFIKPAEPCRPKSSTYGGSQDQAGAVRRLPTAWTYTSSLPILTLFTMLLMLGCVLKVLQLITCTLSISPCLILNVSLGASFARCSTPGLVAWILMQNSGRN